MITDLPAGEKRKEDAPGATGAVLGDAASESGPRYSGVPSSEASDPPSSAPTIAIATQARDRLSRRLRKLKEDVSPWSSFEEDASLDEAIAWAEENEHAREELMSVVQASCDGLEKAYAWLEEIYPEKIWPGRGEPLSDGLAARDARETCKESLSAMASIGVHPSQQ